MTDDRVARIKDFIASGQSVCTLAKRYASKMQVQLVPEEDESVLEPLIAFYDNPESMGLVYVFERDESEHLKAREQVLQLYARIYEEDYVREVGEKGRDFAKRDIDNLRLSLRVFPNWEGPFGTTDVCRSVFFIAMNPLYRRDHPRWAPCSMMFATRESDVLNVPEKLRSMIVKEAEDWMGQPYDMSRVYSMNF